MSLETDFNTTPYWDDYDENKKFYRVVFRPSLPVQARELTQAQTILQKQIERFGNHIFKDGSVVEGCSPTTLPNMSFVRVEDTFTSNSQIFATSVLSNYLLVGATSNVRASVIIAKDGLKTLYPDTNRFYVKYVTTGVNNYTTFLSGETLNVYTDVQNKLGVLDSNNLFANINVITANATANHIGTGYGLKIETGIVFHKGFMQLVDEQTIVVKDYDQNVANYVVGFETAESIVTEDEDPSLFDIALGYENENAPGAHRLKLVPSIVSKPRSSIANNEAFFSVFEFSNITNDLVLNKEKNSYNVVGEVLAERTYDESGDYVTKPFIVETIPGSNSSTIAYQVSSGKGYIHGNLIEYLASRKIETNRATTTLEAPQQIITTNYGNYVYCNEYAGAFDTNNFVNVTLYDATQLAITNRTLSNGNPTGNVIGTARLKAVVHNEGEHGDKDTTYRFFLTNIVMNSGKSFSGAKSIYVSGTYGKAFADIVLTGGRAVLEESGKSTLIFPFGKKALKTLRSSNGSINRTEFYFRATANATLQTNGYISVTTGSPAAGGFEELGYSTGIVGDTLEKEFIVIATSNVSTANISGTVNLNSSSNNISTSGLDSHFANGEFIRLHSNSTVTEFRRVVSVNTSVLVLDSPPSVTNTAANFGKHIPAGYAIPLSSTFPGSRNINITSGSTFEINTGLASSASLTSTANVTVQYRMLRTQARQANKDLRKNIYVKLLANTSANNSWNLGLTDVIKINKVYSNNAGYSETSTTDITDWFTLDTGQRDDIYDHARLVLKPRYAGQLTNQFLTVIVDQFTANTSSGVGFFSVDSYPIDDVNTANTSAIQTAEIPVYDSGTASYDLRDCVDFRGYRANTANSSTTLAGATVNPTTTTNFTSSSTNYLVEPDTNFQADIEYYLGRVDLVTINSTGGLGVVTGTPSENPRTPTNDTDAMVIATAFVPPYPTLSVRENEEYNRLGYTVRIKRSSNRVYTMRDIGVLDQRIRNLEYTTTLNLLEQDAKNIQVPDENGLNRFKNGIFADPMNSHEYGRTTDFEYRWCIDPQLKYGRPLFASENVDLSFANSNSSGVVVTGNYITLPYTHEMYIYQPFATKFRNNTQDAWAWNGLIELFPPYDMNRDETVLPNVDATIDLTQPFANFADAIEAATGATIFGTQFGDWRTLSSETREIARWNRPDIGRGRIRFQVTEEQERVTTNVSMGSTQSSIDLGRYVTDVSVQPYMKSRVVSFIARNLKPNTRIYAFFDEEPVSVHCAPAVLNTALGATVADISNAVVQTGKLEDICVRNGNYGAPLVTDATGTLYGMFLIPANTFRIGDRKLLLTDSDSLVTGADASLTKASATFTASNISISTRNSTITTSVPTIQVDTRVERATNISTWDLVLDPIAQSFVINAPQEQSGVFLTKIDLFFKAKDPTLGATVVVVGMLNGVPNSKKVYGEARLENSNINVSDNASAASTFIFKSPIFLASNESYAFFVLPDGNSPEFKMWMAEIGNFDVITGAQVYQNPYTGDAFRSSNAQTWTAIPTEDVKFNLYVANFTVGTGTASFVNEDDEYINYSSINLANTSNILRVGDQVYPVVSVSNTAITNTSITGLVQSVDTTNAKLKLDSSTGGFTNTMVLGVFRLPQQGNSAQANSTTLVGTININSIANPRLHSIVPRFATAIPQNTKIEFSYKGTSNTGVFDTNYNSLSLDIERDMLDYERLIYSKSTENTLAIGKTLRIDATLTTTNKYISPVIDLSRKAALVIDNIINDDSTNEHTRYGNALCRYISDPITLEDGQESEDIQIYLTAYRPINTDWEVYVKFLNNEDPQTIDSKVWTKLENNSPSLRSSPINTLDFKEFVYTMPNTAPVTSAAFSNQSNFGVLEYVDSTGAVYQTYKTFMIKIVGLSSNKIYVPKIGNIRGLCLQV